MPYPRQQIIVTIAASMIAIAIFGGSPAMGAGGGSGGGGSGNGGSGGNNSSGGSLFNFDSKAQSDASTYHRALLKIDAHNYSEAIPMLQEVLADNPDNPDALNQLGYSYRMIGNLKDSLTAYERALTLQPDHLNAREYLGELYLQMKRPDLAKQQLAILTRLCPSGCEQRAELEEKIGTY